MLISEGEFDPTRQRSGHSGPRRKAFPCRVLVLDGGFRPAVQADGPARSRRPSVPRACCARTARIGLAGKFSMKVTKSAGSALSSMRSHTCRSTDTPPESAAAGADRCGSAEARRHEHEVAAVAPPRSRSFRLRLARRRYRGNRRQRGRGLGRRGHGTPILRRPGLRRLGLPDRQVHGRAAWPR